MPAKEVSSVRSLVPPPPPLPRLFCLVSARDDLSLLPALAAAGVDGFQVRDTQATTRELVELARVVIGSVRPAGAVVVVDDRLDVALATGADGVHLGADDLPVDRAAALAPGLHVGATCRDLAGVERAAAAGATYAGIGPVFATTSKTGLPDPLGPAGVRAATGVLPLVAIGGVGPGLVAPLLDAGAHGVAVLGALWREPDPLTTAEELVRELG